MAFEFAVTEIEERAVRRLAAFKDSNVTKISTDQWELDGVQMDSDEIWAVLSAA